MNEESNQERNVSEGVLPAALTARAKATRAELNQRAAQASLLVSNLKVEDAQSGEPSSSSFDIETEAETLTTESNESLNRAGTQDADDTTTIGQLASVTINDETLTTQPDDSSVEASAEELANAFMSEKIQSPGRNAGTSFFLSNVVASKEVLAARVTQRASKSVDTSQVPVHENMDQQVSTHTLNTSNAMEETDPFGDVETVDWQQEDDSLHEDEEDEDEVMGIEQEEEEDSSLVSLLQKLYDLSTNKRTTRKGHEEEDFTIDATKEQMAASLQDDMAKAEEDAETVECELAKDASPKNLRDQHEHEIANYDRFYNNVDKAIEDPPALFGEHFKEEYSSKLDELRKLNAQWRQGVSSILYY